MSSKRMTANPVKAPRYRPGKDTGHSSASSSEDEAEEQSVPEQKSQPAPKFTNAGTIVSNLGKVDLNARWKTAAAQEAARVERERVERTALEEGFETASEEEDEEGDDDSEEESSEEVSSSEEEEAPRRILLRPTFIKKSRREPKGGVAQDTRPDEIRLAEEEVRRKALADEIVEEQIRKDVAARAAGKKNWDDEEEDVDDVDTTDDLDPDAEYAAWKLRELKRIKRDRERIELRERELEEVERRRNLTAEERNAEDDEFLARQKEEKDGRGKMAYMQKYYHKGVFFQNAEAAAALEKRDIMGSKFADDVQNRELLPQALQMRDMTKLGRKGATKYRDLKSEDTGRWGVFEEKRTGRSDFARDGQGVDERFRPDRDRGGPGGASGANSQPVADRRKRSISREGDKRRKVDSKGSWN